MSADRLHILAICSLFPNVRHPHHGVFVRNRLQALSRYCEVTVVNPIPYFPFAARLARYKDYDLIPRVDSIGGLPVQHPRFFSIPRYWKTLEARTFSRVVLRAAEQLHRHRPIDLIDAHWTYPDLPAAMACAQRFTKPMLVTIRGMEAFYKDQNDRRNSIIAEGIARADRVIALSGELRDESIAHGADPGRCVVIRNGVDTGRFVHARREQARAALGLEGQGRILLSVGSLIYRKGFDRVIRALPAVLTDGEDVHLHIIGSSGPEGDYERELRALAAEQGVAERVHFVGVVRNEGLQQWYNAADLYCLMSRGEGSPNVLTEALACGCPAVATRVGSVPEIMADGVPRGTVVENDDDFDFAGAIREMLARPFDRAAISAYMNGFDWDWCARSVLTQYRALSEN
ncbi:MAG: glycosyltransferase [Gammaproteobacteria bacterium]|nr:glycosyltransferase [Gammaproteobacteria bacterium]